MVKKLKEAQSLFTEIEKVLRAMQSFKTTSTNSLESEVFRILKGIGVEQSSYHCGSLNGKDIKMVMNNANNLFDKFLSLKIRDAR
jgi:hypothetical protein